MKIASRAATPFGWIAGFYAILNGANYLYGMEASVLFYGRKRQLVLRSSAVCIAFCRMKPRVLNLIGAYAMAIPLAIWIAVEIAIRTIPGCKAQMYGDNLCFVGSINLAVPLIEAGVGGIAMFFILTAFVAVPLFVTAAVLSWRAKRREHAA